VPNGIIVALKQKNTMGYFKTFMLGVGVALGVYYITKKRSDGRSKLDDILEDPELYLEKAKDYAIAEGVRTLKRVIY